MAVYWQASELANIRSWIQCHCGSVVATLIPHAKSHTHLFSIFHVGTKPCTYAQRPVIQPVGAWLQPANSSNSKHITHTEPAYCVYRVYSNSITVQPKGPGTSMMTADWQCELGSSYSPMVGPIIVLDMCRQQCCECQHVLPAL